MMNNPHPPYTQIALFYDKLMSHVDYKGWAKYIRKVLKKYHRASTLILDMGCGTGTMMGHLQKFGYQVNGFDLALPMVQTAKSRTLDGFWQGDMRSPACKQVFDAVICLYDTINYFQTEELYPLFLSTKACLKEGGLFIFDAITEKLVRAYWANYTEQESGIDYVYTRHSWYESHLRKQHTDFEIRFEDRPVVFENHVQWIHPLAGIETELIDAGFRILGCFDELTFKPGKESSERVHFVVRKEVF